MYLDLSICLCLKIELIG